jgi:hypothetical protein
MAKETSNNPEFAAPTNVFREVFVSVLNSSNAVLILLSYYLTSGQWDPSAPNGVPTQAYQVGQGTTPVWGNYTPVPFTAVAGQMTFNGNSSNVVVSWNWTYGSDPTANVTVNGTTLKASVTLANPTTSSITAQVIITGNA